LEKGKKWKKKKEGAKRDTKKETSLVSGIGVSKIIFQFAIPPKQSSQIKEDLSHKCRSGHLLLLGDTLP
jgi:hypothetical protein